MSTQAHKHSDTQALGFVDTHQHLWEPSRFKYTWCAGIPVLNKSFLLKDYLDASKKAEGVQIFIGAESHLFGVAGCSLIIAPYQNSRERIVGAIGVIGPTRINYARIIPMVDYTAKMIGRLIG